MLKIKGNTNNEITHKINNTTSALSTHGNFLIANNCKKFH